MPRDDGGKVSVRRQQAHGHAGKKGPRAAGPAKDSVQRRRDRRRGDGSTSSCVRKPACATAMIEPRRHSVARGVAEEKRERSVREGDEVVEISADHVRDPVVGGQLESRKTKEGSIGIRLA